MLKAVALVKTTLEKKRQDEEFAGLFRKAQDLKSELDLEDIVAPRVRRPPKRFGGPAEAFTADGPEQYYRLEYYKVVDTALAQLCTRLEQDGLQTYTSLEECLLSGVVVEDVCLKYPELDVRLLQMQLPMFKKEFVFTCLDEAASVMRSAVPEVRKLFAQVEILLRLLIVVPATSCEAERSFSSLRRLKTWLRSTMSQNRLNNVAVCNVHQHYIDNIDIRSLVNEFVSANDRREKLFGKC